MPSRLSYLFQTLRHLKFQQGIALLSQRLLPRASVSRGALPEVLTTPSDWLLAPAKHDSWQLPDQFCFLNEIHQVSSPTFWNTGATTYLWHYNLHYFDYLVSSTSLAYPESASQWIDRWISENPPFSGRGWEPYPISLRVINWLKFAWQNQPLTEGQTQSLALQIRWLYANLEYHLLANHLFTNAKTLVFAGLAFAGDEAQVWLKRGLKVLLAQIPEQFLADGGHFERCPMYHGILLEDLLDLLNLIQASQSTWKTFDAKVQSDICRLQLLITEKWDALWTWYEAMRHPDGHFPLFNDSAYGIAPEFNAVLEYAERLGVSTSTTDRTVFPNLWHAEDSQFVRLQYGPWLLFWDIGGPAPSYQPGHAHAGTLGFELSFAGQRLIVDTGISTYEPNTQRLLERSTKAHNTLTVDDLNSSEVWSSFRVAHRAKTFDYYQNLDDLWIEVGCSHNGYSRFSDLGFHQRRLQLASTKLTVIDQITGRGCHQLQSRFHLAPGLQLKVASNSTTAKILDISGATVCNLKVDGALIKSELATHYPEFGKGISIACLVVYTETLLPHTIQIVFECKSFSEESSGNNL